MMNVAMADGAIMCWDAKYEYEYWRPVTGIHRAGEDGNPLTAPDPGWQPLADILAPPNTPPFPAYTSGHSTFGAAAAEIMREFWGTDRIEFTCGSDDLPGVFRDFTSLSQAAQENADSRVYLGVHWDFDATYGISSGTVLGDYVFNNFFRPVACYPDCNKSGTLTAADFSCFQARFVAGDPYADCNQSGVLTIADFACFQAQFGAGCP